MSESEGPARMMRNPALPPSVSLADAIRMQQAIDDAELERASPVRAVLQNPTDANGSEA